ncbi:pentapeptide repeat-containing protein [Nonomuraea endophytica]|uniref:Pentapeptide repeat-containing protein n=1 Tax=Nonomuraea endophytica TaxID=714136 RepID=A0A7W8AFI7_9ACTN|nr:pentapeptide repeat-containing protein [Nonomuraea endophytica]MBB5085252.1 hypothetical protein [Nonomuraea endophytica]
MPAREVAAAAAARARRAQRQAEVASNAQATPQAVETNGFWLGLRWLAGAAVAVACVYLSIAIAAIENAPWLLIGLPLAVAATLVMVAVMGPLARRLAGERRPFTAQERASLTMRERMDAVNHSRGMLIQSVTGLIVFGGLVFTAQGVLYTAQTVEATQQGQLTDRYTKAIEQLGSSTLQVRLGGIYALGRLAEDSERDTEAIYDILAAFVRDHASGSLRSMSSSDRPATDVQAVLTIIARRPLPNETIFRGLDGSEYFSEDSAQVIDLGGTRLRGAELRLSSGDSANLIKVNLAGADLSGADMAGAHLRGADLSAANLAGADLSGADLRGVIGVTQAQVKAIAKIDKYTRFGECLPDYECWERLN